MRYTTGRLKSDYQYSVNLVYNNFPWPDASGKQRTAIEKAAQAVLDARASFADSTLADLYDPLTMPPALLKAHQQLDKAVDAAYGRKAFASEAERIAFLFQRYQAITSLLAEDARPSGVKKPPPELAANFGRIDNATLRGAGPWRFTRSARKHRACWISRRDNCAQANMLFGDRAPADA